MDKTIKEIKEMKAQCESEIRATLVIFEKQSESSVEAVDILHKYHIDGKQKL